MTRPNEAERIELYTTGEQPPPVEISITARNTRDNLVSLAKIREIMTLIATKRTEAWPEHSWWETNLPEWFTSSFGSYTLDEILKNPELWDFRSWLQAMKDPGWEWWSSATTEDGWLIRLQAMVHPYSIGALEYLARVSGAKLIVVHD